MLIKRIKRSASQESLPAALQSYVKKGFSVNKLTWLILGDKNFIKDEPKSMLDFVINGKSIQKLAAINLAEVLDISIKDMAGLLNVSYKTLSRKRKTDTLNSVISSLLIEIANTTAKGLSVFENVEKFNRWLHKENNSLKGQKPFDLLNTPTGIKLVSQVLGRIEEGVYT